MASQTHYETLSITPDFPSEAIEGLRKALSRLYHPSGGSSPDAERMAQINRACDVLRDPRTRAVYDRSLLQEPPDAAPAPAPAPASAPALPGSLFTKQTSWLTPPIGGTDVLVVMTADRLLICQPHAGSATGGQPKVLTNVPLRSIVEASRYDAAGSSGRIRFLTTGGTYRFADGWHDLAPAIRAQIVAMGRSVADEGADAWRVGP